MGWLAGGRRADYPLEGAAKIVRLDAGNDSRGYLARVGCNFKDRRIRRADRSGLDADLLALGGRRARHLFRGRRDRLAGFRHYRGATVGSAAARAAVAAPRRSRRHSHTTVRDGSKPAAYRAAWDRRGRTYRTYCTGRGAFEARSTWPRAHDISGPSKCRSRRRLLFA